MLFQTHMKKILAHISGKLALANDNLIDKDGTPFYAHPTTCPFPFIIKNGLCCGCSTVVRTDIDVYAGVDVDGI